MKTGQVNDSWSNISDMGVIICRIHWRPVLILTLAAERGIKSKALLYPLQVCAEENFTPWSPICHGKAECQTWSVCFLGGHCCGHFGEWDL